MAQPFSLPAETMSEYIPVAPKVPERVIGFYNNGCILGAKPFAASTDVWELMNTTRNHQYAHSSTLDVVKKLGSKSVANGWGKLAVGDSSCPMGGKMHQGHNSHQVGLDVDIFYKFIPKGQTLKHAQRNSWTDKDQEAVEIAKYDRPYIGENQETDPEKLMKPYFNSVAVRPGQKPAFLQLLREAALDPQVQRIFVSPPIKAALCREYGDWALNQWLAKIRPEGGHRSHFHVRLRCPPDSPLCKPQVPDPPPLDCSGEGIDYWFKPVARVEPPPQPSPKPKNPPAECVAARAALKPVKVDETSMCLTDPDGSMRCRDYKTATTYTRPKPAPGIPPATR